MYFQIQNTLTSDITIGERMLKGQEMLDIKVLYFKDKIS